MILPTIQTYTKAEIEEACSFSSALGLALKHAQNTNEDFDPLSKLRYTAWSQAVLATYFAKVSAQEICLAWSETADKILQTVAIELGAPPELALFAFGKLGSRELNLSSDVDVILVGVSDRPEHIAFLRKFQARLSTATENGFLFRVDFDLRPGGKLGPLVPTVDQFTDFYGNYGETWERLAFIRLRAVWGNPEVINNILNFTKRFVFRKHLDFSLLEDLKTLRAKVHDHYWKRSTPEQTDLKLGVGGIRDLELFTHALQVVHGGKDAKLHIGDTTAALEAFSTHKILPEKDVIFLKNFYWALRSLENSVQAIGDRQTHILLHSQILPQYLLAIKAALPANLAECDRIVSTLLGKISANPQSLPEHLDRQKDWLRSLNFAEIEIEEVWPQILAVPVFSRNKERDLEIRNRFLFQFLERMKDSGQQASLQRLSLLKEFLQASKAKTSFFSMLLSNQPLLDILVHLFSSSPYLAKIVCARPELLDSLVMRNIEELEPETAPMDTFLDSLAERRMLAEIVGGVELLRGDTLENMTKNLTETADRICVQLLKKVGLELATAPPAILALGKWGGEELGLRSDLDCIFVTAEAPTELDHKVVRRFINRLTETHRGGSLYSIDTRLNMSGAGGVLITSKSDLLLYLKNQSQCWERQAYLRSRWIASENSDDSPSSVCTHRKLSHEDLTELEKIRIELLKSAKSNLDLKYSEGGLVDTEFAVQIAVLQKGILLKKASTQSMILALTEADPIWKATSAQLLANYNLMRLVEQLKKLLSEENSSIIGTDQSYLAPIADRLKMSAESLPEQIKQALTSQLSILKKLDPRRAQSY